jgi:hypothetical protein
VISSEYVEAREATMVKVQLEGGRVRTYFNTDITRFSANLFGPEQVKIKSLVCPQPAHNHSIHLVCIYIATCDMRVCWIGV